MELRGMRDGGELCSRTELWEASREEWDLGVLRGSRLAEGRVWVTVSSLRVGARSDLAVFIPTKKVGAAPSGWAVSANTPCGGRALCEGPPGFIPGLWALPLPSQASVAQGRMGMETPPWQPGG